MVGEIGEVCLIIHKKASYSMILGRINGALHNKYGNLDILLYNLAN